MGNVAIAGLSKRYGTAHPVLDGIDLLVADGEFFTLLGPSGCGKTTLLRTIAGFLPQDSGTIAFDGTVVDALPAHRRDIGMVFQDYAIFPHLSVAQNVAYGLRARRLKRAETQARVAEAIALVRLSGLEARSPGALSGGQQQRVGIARALAIRPRLLLMDEPLSNLDAKLRLEMRDDIRAIQRRLGITTIYVTHDQEEALAISDRICVLQSGRIEQVGSPAEIYRRPARRFPAAFVGSMNFLPGRIDASGQLDFAGGAWTVDAACPPGPVELAIRPEAVRLGAEAAGITLRGPVEKAVFLGRDQAITVQTASGAVTLHAPVAADPGTVLDLTLPFDALALFAADGAGLPARIAAAS